MNLNPLNNRVYDILKWLALLVFPTLAGALIALQEIWSAPVDQGIIAGLTALSTAIGAMLMISSSLYYIRGGAEVKIPTMPVKVYRVIQEITIYWLPAFATFYYLLSLFFHMHYTMPIVETTVVVQVFLGLILGTYSTQTGDLRYWVKKNLQDILSRVLGVVSPSK